MIADEVLTKHEFLSFLQNLTSAAPGSPQDALDFEQFFEMSKYLGTRIHQYHLKEVEEHRLTQRIDLPTAEEMDRPEFETEARQQFERVTAGVSQINFPPFH
jgi:repressor of nif and glnA expression